MDSRILTAKLHPLARLPVKDTEGSAGYSLFSVDDYVLQPHQRQSIDTGLAVEIPPGCYGRIAPKSGLAKNYGIDVLGGVVDRDFRGRVTVILLNTGDKELYIRPGYRVAQLMIERVANPCFYEVGYHQLSKTLRTTVDM